MMAMNNADPMRFSPIVERGLLAYELDLPFFSAP